MKEKNLKLIARTEEDLRVVSAHLQDSIANVTDIANLQKNKIFLLQLKQSTTKILSSHIYLGVKTNFSMGG